MQGNTVARALITGLLMITAIGTSGCASWTGGDVAAGDRNLLTREQLEPVSFMSAYQAIQRLRPIWLRSDRGQDSFISQERRGLRVYVDGVLYGNLPSLTTLQVRDIQEIRFLDAREATMQFGIDHGEGVVLVVTI